MERAAILTDKIIQNIGIILLKSLDFYHTGRSKIIDIIIDKIPGSALLYETSGMVHLLASFSCISMFFMITQASKGILPIFSFHPYFMSLGILIFMTEGIIAYRNLSFLQCCGDIMQSNNKKQKIRTIHRALNCTAVVFMCMGLSFIFWNKVRFQKDLIPHTLHSVVGTFTFVIILYQAMIGFEKLDLLNRTTTTITTTTTDSNFATEMKSYKWHGKCGLFLYDFSVISIITGCAEFFPPSNMHMCTDITILALWLCAHMQCRSTTDKYSRGIIGSDDIIVNDDNNIADL